MSNVNRPAGFQVAGHLGGGLPNRLSRHHIASGGAFNFYRGDAAVPTATSKNIARPAAATDRLIGIFDGCFYIDGQGLTIYDAKWPTGTVPLSGTTVDAFVYDDPSTIFEVQCSASLAAADLGALADLSIGTGNNYTKQSGDQIDSTTFASGAVFKMLDYSARPENDTASANVKALVVIASHYLAGAKTAI